MGMQEKKKKKLRTLQEVGWFVPPPEIRWRCRCRCRWSWLGRGKLDEVQGRYVRGAGGATFGQEVAGFSGRAAVTTEASERPRLNVRDRSH